MAARSKRAKRESRQRRSLSLLTRAVERYQLVEQNEALRQAIAREQNTRAYSETVLKAVIAQHGPQTFTKGTLEQVMEDDDQVLRVESVKDSQPEEYVAKVITKAEAQAAMQVKASVKDNTPKVEITTVHEADVDAAIAAVEGSAQTFVEQAETQSVGDETV